MIGCKTGTWDRLDLPQLPVAESWVEVAAIKLGDGDVLWDSKVSASNGSTSRGTIIQELFCSEEELKKLNVQVEGVGGKREDLELTVRGDGKVAIPRRTETPWSDIKHVAFVKHANGTVTFRPVKAVEAVVAVVAVEAVELPELRPVSSWREVTAIKGGLRTGDVLWDSKVIANGSTSRKYIIQELFGREHKEGEKLKVRVEVVGGDEPELELTVGKKGNVRIPRKKDTRWSDIKHVAFVKHANGTVTFRPVKAVELPELRPVSSWRKVTAIKLDTGDVLLDSKLIANTGATSRAIIHELFGREDERKKLKVWVEEVGGDELELTVRATGQVAIPRKKRTPWSDIEHVAFVKHADDTVTFRPVKAVEAVALPDLPDPRTWLSGEELAKELAEKFPDARVWYSKRSQSATHRTTISKDLFDSETKLTGLTASISSVEGVEMTFGVNQSSGQVAIPNMPETDWSAKVLKRVAFVKHANDKVTFHPLRVDGEGFELESNPPRGETGDGRDVDAVDEVVDREGFELDSNPPRGETDGRDDAADAAVAAVDAVAAVAADAADAGDRVDEVVDREGFELDSNPPRGETDDGRDVDTAGAAGADRVDEVVDGDISDVVGF